MMNEEMLKQKISQFKWYQPINFGNGVTIENWVGPHTEESMNLVLKKWNFIIERNLPNVQGLRVLDIGCNCGLYCVQLARMGAREVVGIDSNATWAFWREQASFVKEALEWRCRTTYHIEYIDSPMQNIPKLDLSRFDLVMALCSIYYISVKEMHALLSHFKESGCPRILLQGNTNRGDQSKETFRKAQPKFLAGHAAEGRILLYFV